MTVIPAQDSCGDWHGVEWLYPASLSVLPATQHTLDSQMVMGWMLPERRGGWASWCGVRPETA